ncbi:uncharacterized protein [Ptychodera flava]|uniref:uncharacterized protein n=1 Tax=Ptychodera flava TaxID=63121 RepID=UPI00396AA620
MASRMGTRIIILEDVLQCKYIPSSHCSRNIEKQVCRVVLEVDTDSSTGTTAKGSVYLTLDRAKTTRGSCPWRTWKTFELNSGNFRGMDIGPRDKDGEKLILIFKSSGSKENTSLLQLKARKFTAHCLGVISLPDMTRWRDLVASHLMEKDQSFEVDISQSHGDLPEGKMNLYVLPTRMILSTVYEKRRSPPRCVMDQPITNFALSYSQGERVYILKVEGESDKKFLRTRTTDDSERIARKYDQFRREILARRQATCDLPPRTQVPNGSLRTPQMSETLRVEIPEKSTETDARPNITSPTENITTRQCTCERAQALPPVGPTNPAASGIGRIDRKVTPSPKHETLFQAPAPQNGDPGFYCNLPDSVPPLPPRPQREKLEVLVAVFAGRPCLGGTWIVDVYIVNKDKDPGEIREKLQQCKTSKDHIALPNKLVEVTDTLVIDMSKLPPGWRFLENSQSKMLTYDEVQAITNRSTIGSVLDESHQFLIYHEGLSMCDKFLCTVRIQGQNRACYTLSTNFSNYAKPGEQLSEVDRMVAEIQNREVNSPNFRWLTNKKLSEMGRLLTPLSVVGEDWRHLLDHAGFDFLVIDDIERTFARTHISPGELVLRLWYRTKPEEFTQERLRDVFFRMGRDDVLSVLDGEDEDHERTCIFRYSVGSAAGVTANVHSTSEAAKSEPQKTTSESSGLGRPCQAEHCELAFGEPESRFSGAENVSVSHTASRDANEVTEVAVQPNRTHLADTNTDGTLREKDGATSETEDES